MTPKKALRNTSDLFNLSGRFIALALVYLMIIPMMSIGSSAQSSKNLNLQTNDQLKDISPDAQVQIQSLLDEKNSRTPAQQKIDSQLLYAAKMRRGESITSSIATLEVNVGADENGIVTVDISADVSAKLLSRLKEIGADILSSSVEYHTLRAQVALDKLEAIAELPQVRFIMPRQESMTSRIDQSRIPPAAPQLYSGPGGYSANPKARFQQVMSDLMGAGLGGGSTTNYLPNGYNTVGSANAEGVITHGAYSARGAFNTDGTGVKIGVLSNGVTNLAASQGLGDLGAVTVLPGQAGSGDEGTAMLEVIHDIAPGAQLYFAASTNTITQFAQNIRDLRTAGCDIIVDDVFFFAESPFQDGQVAPVVSSTNGGVVTQAVNDVTAAGALYFSSAGNSGNKNDATSGAWEGDFVSGGTLALTPGGNVQDFDPGVAINQNNILTLGAGNPMSLTWSDPLGGSTNDYDLFVLNNAGTAVSTSATNIQNGTQDPFEQVSTNNTTGRRLVILQKTGAQNRFLHINTNRAALTFSTNGTTYGHSHAANAFSTAATPAFSPFSFPVGPTFFNGPFPNAHSATDKVETFSSDGPRRIFFNPNSSAITPADFSSTGGTLRQKPDITASDGEQVTGVGGFGTPFFGTSCAAPTAAAIAGLIKAANPSLTPAQIRTALTSSALDIETAGTDQDAGAGVVMAVPALTAASLTGKAFIELNSATATESGGNANGVIEQNEGGTLTLNLKNTGLLSATGITTTLTTSTPNVTVTQGSSAYTNLTSLGGSANNTTAYSFQMNNLTPTDLIIDFSLTINYTNGWNASQVINFKLRTGRLPISTTLDASAPPTSTSYPITASGNQTGRLNLNGVASTCGAPKANPGAAATGSRAYDSYTFTNPLGVPVCTTVTLTQDKQSNDFILMTAYAGSFNPAAPSTNYLADWGNGTLYAPMTMSFNVAANQTIVIVIVGNTAGLTGTPYKLDVSGLRLLAPTAAKVSVTGRVAANGQGVKNAAVTMSGSDGVARRALTNGLGNYRFDDVEVGKTYTFQVSAKRHRFEAQVVTINDETNDLNFDGQ
jgi:hypothetical protein